MKPNEPQLDPTLKPITAIQADRLAALTGTDATQLVQRPIADLAKDLKWQVDPDLFRFERVCGQVVKIDPVTGAKHPVPFATVDVNNVTCNWYWFSPRSWLYSWAFPFGRCTTELLSEVTADECGNFCVWVPRFDIEWVLRWRKERICLPGVLQRPTVGDILRQHLPQLPPVGPNPPDPQPIVDLLTQREDLATQLGPVAEQLRVAAKAHAFAGSAAVLSQALDRPAFTAAVPPPVPSELRLLTSADASQALVTLAKLRTAPEGEVDFSRYFGPFQRCFDIEMPEWTPMFEVPDITFVVKQDTNGDGTLDVIYDGAFDVSWGSAEPVHVELDVSANAIASPVPGCFASVPCGDVPAIQQLGLMAVEPSYWDNATGFALHMNEPAGGLDASAPFGGGMPIFGCVQGLGEYYRILDSYADSDGLTTLNPALDGTLAPLPAAAFSSPAPVVAAWRQELVAGGPANVGPVDTDGWYRVRTDLFLPEWIMEWSPIDGVHKLTVEMGTGTPGAITATGATSAEVTVAVDSSYPTVANFEATWRYTTDPDTTANGFTTDCKLIARTPGADVLVTIAYAVTAKHLFEVSLGAGGCGAATVTTTTGDDITGTWRYPNSFTNHVAGSATYLVAGTAQPGCYGWTLSARSRAFSALNPDGPLLPLPPLPPHPAWDFDSFPWHVDPSLSIAIVDA